MATNKAETTNAADACGHLVLSRKRDETVRVGDDVMIRVEQIQGNRVRIGVVAPRTLRIVRGELYDQEPRRTAA